MAKSKTSTMTASFSAVVFLLLILLYGGHAVEEYHRGLRGELLRPTRAKTTKKLNCLNHHCLPTAVHDVQARGVRKAKANEDSITYDIFEPNGVDSVNTEATVDMNMKTMKARFKPRPKPEIARANPAPATSPSPPVLVSKVTPPSAPKDESFASKTDSPTSTSQTLSPRAGVEKEVVASPWPPKTTDHFPDPTTEAAEPGGNVDTSPKPLDDEAAPAKDIGGDKIDVLVSGQKGGIQVESDKMVPATQSEEPKEDNSSRKTTGFFSGAIVVFLVATFICFAGTRLHAKLRSKRAKKGTALHEKGSITSEDGKSSLDPSFEQSPHVSAQSWTELHFEDFLSSPEDDRASSPLRMLGRSPRTSPACMVLRIQGEEERSLNSDLSERKRATAMNVMPSFDEYLEEFSCEEAKMPMPPVSPSESSTEHAPIEHVQFKTMSHLELGSMSSMYSSVESESETDDEYVDGTNVDEKGQQEAEQQPQQDKSPLHPQATPPSSPPRRQTQSPRHSPFRAVPPYPNQTSPTVYPNLPAPLSLPPNEPLSMEASASAVPQPTPSTRLAPARKASTSRAGVDPNFLKMLGKYSSDSMDEDEDENAIIGDIQPARTLVNNDFNNHNQDDEPLFSNSNAPGTPHGGIDARFLQRIGMNIGNNNEESNSVLQGDSSSSPWPPSASSFNSVAPGR